MKSAKSVKTLALGFSHFHPNGNSLLAEKIILFLKMMISAWVDVKNEMSLLSMFMLMRLFIHSKKKNNVPPRKKIIPPVQTMWIPPDLRRFLIGNREFSAGYAWWDCNGLKVPPTLSVLHFSFLLNMGFLARQNIISVKANECYKSVLNGYLISTHLMLIDGEVAVM